jgi:hypothetical protein
MAGVSDDEEQLEYDGETNRGWFLIEAFSWG